MVDLIGIAHLVVEDVPPSLDFFRKAEPLFWDIPDLDAYGVIFLDSAKGAITPLVKVPAADSLVWEGSCGSGSLAAAIAQSQDAPDGPFVRTYIQPAGAVEAAVLRRDGEAVSAWRLGQPGCPCYSTALKEGYSAMPRIRNDRNDSIDQLFRGILALRDVEECYRFFGDLLTVQELSAFAQRLQVARMLSEGKTYETIRAEIATSSSTITRVNTELRYGSGGYQMVLERLKEEDSE